MSIAKTILQQLGGGQFVAMTGAKNFGTTGNDLSFKIGRNSKSITHVSIELNGFDLYDVKYFRIRGAKRTLVHEDNNVYCDMVAAGFETATGLYTHL